MIIKSSANTVKFFKIPLGGTFQFNNEIYMTIQYVETDEGAVNSVKLSNGELFYVEDYEEVKEVKGYFQVE